MRISVFCSVKELHAWVTCLCDKFHLGIIAYSGDRLQNCNVTHRGSLQGLDNSMRRVFLFSETESLPEEVSFAAIKPRLWGWIDIAIGGVDRDASQNVLLLTEIEIAKPSQVKWPTWKAVRYLKRIIADGTTSRVIGMNLITGASSEYDDIYYTEESKKKYISGFLWKQRANANVLFKPLGVQTSGAVAELGALTPPP
jgi:hypothetical protein